MNTFRKSIATVLLGLVASAALADATLLNASYDVARDVYKDYNPMFQKYWKAKAGESVELKQSHGGSTKQVRAVADGLEADVVTMNQANDIEFLADTGPGRQGLGQEIPQQRLALHLGHGLHRAQGQSRRAQGLERPGRAGRAGDHPPPEEHRQRPQHLPGGLGLGPQAAGRQRQDARRSSSASCSRTPRCSLPAAAMPPPPSCSAAWATCWSPSSPRPR